MSEQLENGRPFCSDTSRAAAEPLGATASRARRWVLVEYAGHWPRKPLDAAPFAGRVGEALRRRLDALEDIKLLLVKPPPGERGGGIAVVLGTTPERGGWFHRLDLDSHLDLLDLDLAAAFESEPPGRPLAAPLLLVCTHGTRDRCCARYGQELCRTLTSGPHAGWVWQTSHVGGHRFAGNLVCLPEGLYFGRLDPGAAERVLSEYLEGRIELGHYRGRSALSAPAQAAELHVRERTRLRGFHDLRVLNEERTGESAWTVTILAEVAGDVHRVEVVRGRGPAVLESCADDEVEQPKRFEARGLVSAPA